MTTFRRLRPVSRWVTAAMVPGLALAAPPVAADDVEYAGTTCSYFAASDATDVIVGPSRWFGVLTAGVWAAADVVDDASGGTPHQMDTTMIDVHCWMQLNDATFYPDVHGDAGRHCHQNVDLPVVAPAACRLDFAASSFDAMYVCTQVVFSHFNPPYTEEYWHDADANPANGTQCALAASVGIGTGKDMLQTTAFVAPEPVHTP